MTPEAFLEHVYKLAIGPSAGPGSVAVMNHLNGLLLDGKPDECDQILRLVDVAKLPIRIALAFLTISNLLPEEMLPARPRLVDAIQAKLTEELGVERTEAILKGLR